MLKKIHIKNYKCFKDFCFDLNDNSTFITGDNGIGKSALFEIIHIINQIVGYSNSDVNKIFKKQDFNDLNIPIDIDIVLEIQSITYQYKFSIVYEHSWKKTVVNEELLIDNKTFFFKNKFGNVSFVDNAFDIDDNELALLIVLFTYSKDKNIEILFEWLSHMILFSPNQTEKLDSYCNDFILAHDGRNFLGWLNRILKSEPSFYIPFIETLKSILPGLNKISFVRWNNSYKTMQISFSHAQNTTTVDFENLSNGEKIIFILTAITCWIEYSERVSCVFVDEPSNYIVNNDVIEKIVQNLVNKANKNNVQLLITSNQQFKNVNSYCMVREDRFSPTNVKKLNGV